MTQTSERIFDLEERSLEFARRVRALVKEMHQTPAALEDIRQLVRASGSVGANYIEANECLGPKDFQFHIKISRKEAKESRFFLRLLSLTPGSVLETERSQLVQEATELMNIFGAIYRKTAGNKAKAPKTIPGADSDE